MRVADYAQLHRDLAGKLDAPNATSARVILKIVREYVEVGSMLDVGCGAGTWLRVARELGISDTVGIDASWSEAEIKLDLEQPFALGRRFDLVVSLEVAEHLSERAAEGFVGSLVKHGQAVLFSAAIPGQGGTGHINEQFPAYWVERFKRRRYRLLDVIRGPLWDDPGVLWWLRQNALLFVDQATVEASPKAAQAARESHSRPLTLIHPSLYLHHLTRLSKLLSI
jgi:SAM-dependent methyltransferase